MYLGKPSRRPAWLRVDRLLGEHGIPRDSPAGRRQLEMRMEERRRQEMPDEWKAIRRGWCWGDEVFRRELLAQVAQKMGEHHYGKERRESVEEKAERLVREGLAKANWSEKDLARHPKGDPVKLAVAVRLRAESTVPLKWIARRLQMGTWRYLTRLLYQFRKTQRPG